MSDRDDVYFRAVDVKTPAPIVFRWLCQLKVASYSYDWIDKLERTFFEGQERIPSPYNPKELTPGTENLAPGQRFMGVFKLVEFEQNRHLTMIMDAPRAIAIFGGIAASYVVFPITENTCRLVLKGHVRYPRNGFGLWMRWFLPWGDLFMLQKQFLTLKYLAEGQAA
jgi:type IV secretory pathway TrbD component